MRVIADREADTARVRVANTGPGIPPEDLPRVWERFYRVEKSRVRERGGAGIGLAIVKQLVGGGRRTGRRGVRRGVDGVHGRAARLTAPANVGGGLPCRLQGRPAYARGTGQAAGSSRARCPVGAPVREQLVAWAGDCMVRGGVELGDGRLSDQVNELDVVTFFDATLRAFDDGHEVACRTRSRWSAASST